MTKLRFIGLSTSRKVSDDRPTCKELNNYYSPKHDFYILSRERKQHGWHYLKQSTRRKQNTVHEVHETTCLLFWSCHLCPDIVGATGKIQGSSKQSSSFQSLIPGYNLSVPHTTSQKGCCVHPPTVLYFVFCPRSYDMSRLSR